MRSSSPRVPKRGPWRWLAIVGITLTLTACADGVATDAERSRQADATRESIVTDLQATQTWNIIHGTPGTTPPPEE